MTKSILIAVLISLLTISCQNSGEQGAIPPVVDTTLTDGGITSGNVDSGDEGRYAWQKPELVIDKLGDIRGKIIADIGAGTGYFTFRLIPRAEKVIAVDIDPNMIELIKIFRENLDSLQQQKIETRLAKSDDPMLDEAEIDIAVIINTIGYIGDRSAYLANLSKSLKEGGEVMIVDFKMKRIPDNIAPPIEYRVNILELENLLEEIGYQLISTDDRSLDYQFILKARKKP